MRRLREYHIVTVECLENVLLSRGVREEWPGPHPRDSDRQSLVVRLRQQLTIQQPGIRMLDYDFKASWSL